VQQGLDALMQNRTVLAVAHRLSTVVSFDRILVVEDGRVVEDGPPLKLLKEEGGAFQQLWALQAEGLEDPTIERASPIVPQHGAMPPVLRNRGSSRAALRRRRSFAAMVRGE
jgi:ABC-type multidrug transport system ATPase subunit